MRRAVPMMSLLAGVLTASMASATVCNIDLTNTGTHTAYDVEIVLSGVQGITDHYNGTPGPDDVFNNFGVLYSSDGNTHLHWTSPQSPIPPVPKGSPIQAHVGFTTTNNNCPIVDFFWTGLDGKRIPGSLIGILQNHLSNTSLTITNTYDQEVAVGPVRFGCTTSTITLPELGRNSDLVQSILTTISPGATLAAGQTLQIPLPPPTCTQCSCVSTYHISGPGFDGESSPWFLDPLPQQ
jgi:hypothetical protein